MAVNHNANAFPPEYATRLVDTFLLIDELLTRTVNCLDPIALASPFSARKADATPVHQQVVADHAVHLRQAMDDILKRHCIPIPHPATSATQASRVLIDEALIAAASLDPRGSRGGAGLSSELVGDACRVVNEVMDLLAILGRDLADPATSKAGGQSLQPGLDEDLAALLRDMKRAAAAQGLARLGLSIDALTQRLQSRDITIGVFGAVNTGKSSLLNCFLGSALLPVSAIPATVVPIQISYGLQERGWVEFVDGRPEVFDRARLAEFVDTHFNTDNLHHITHIRFRMPAPALQRGITLIDMPGTARFSDSTVFTEQAQMLRCDLAVVLISAVASLTLDEIKLVDALRHAGTDVMVLITKVDLLAPEDRWRIYGHVVRELWQKAHLEIPVYIVSTRDTDAALCRAWIDGPLAEYIELYRDRRQAALQRKVDTLRGDVINALEWQLPRCDRRVAPTAEKSRLLASLSNTRIELERALAALADQDRNQPRNQEAFINEVAHNAAALWMGDRRPSFEVTRILELAAMASARDAATMAAHQIEKLRAQAAMTLTTAADALELPGSKYGSFPAVSDPPAFISEGKLPATAIPRTFGALLLGRWGFYLTARRRLRHSPASMVLEHALSDYLVTLNSWKQSNLTMFLKTYAEQQCKLQACLSKLDEKPVFNPPDTWMRELLADIATLRERTAHVRR